MWLRDFVMNCMNHRPKHGIFLVKEGIRRGLPNGGGIGPGNGLILANCTIFDG